MRAGRLILVITAILLTASFSYGATVNDTGSPNFWPGWSFPFYDYRDTGGWGTIPLGKEGISGAYFQVTTAIQTGGYLMDFNKVISITATHSPSGRIYSLAPASCRDWQLPNHWPWSVFLRPEDWMFSGTWSYTLVYTGSDKKEHMQICKGPLDPSGNLIPLVAGPNRAFPPAVSNAQMIGTGTGDILVSWSGIGDNGSKLDYQIDIFTEDDVCVEVVYRMEWRGPLYGFTCPTGQVCVGTYDSGLNRVSFIVLGGYSGRLIRLRQQIITPNRGSPRASKQIRLPE